MLLQVENLSVHYDGMQALFGVDLHVDEGEMVSILGANGAGKSTFINAVSGMRKLTSGEIRFAGARVTDVPAHARVPLGIGQVPEGRRLFPMMTVEENLLLGATPKKAHARRKETLDELYQFLPRLKERRGQIAKTLSGGEQQMVAVGRAMMSQPTLLMLDEPSLGLSPIMVKELFAMIGHISAQGVTVLLVEQNVKQTLELVDRSYVLENGHVTMEGKGTDLLENDHVKKAFLGM